MSRVRIIVKETYQPPIDTPASISWQTIDISHDELSDLIGDSKKGYSDRNYKHSTFEVVGAEVVEESECK